MGLSGEQKRTTRTNASTARTTTRKQGRVATPTTTRTAAANGTRRAKATPAGKASAASANGTRRTNGAAPASARTAKKPAAPRTGASSTVTKALARHGAKNGASNGAGPGLDYLEPSSIERRKSRINGWGVFALQDIPKNKRIVYYAGERISAKDSGPREERYLERGHIWCFQVNRAWVIDAAIGGNIARFVNHACKPNCYTHIVDGVIWIRAGKTIRKGEELTYNYYTEGQAEIPCRCVPGCQGML